MIFRRRKRGDAGQGETAADAVETATDRTAVGEVDDDTTAAEPTDADDAVTDEAAASNESEAVEESEELESDQADEAGTSDQTGAAELDVDDLDGREWRGEGPYDITEIDLESGNAGPRIDLGSMIITGFEGAELRLQVADENQQIVSAMLISKDSALELGAFAAPRSGGLWPELREELIEAATAAGGSAAVVEGPFGVELRRLLPVQTPDGEQGYQPSRMWVAEGPRWLLRGIVYGQAALVDGLESPVAELLTCFRATVVRRGDEARAPGDLLPLSLPRSEEAEREASEGLEGAG